MTDDQKVTRKLRAILSADVKGYSRLMSDDESYTIRTLKEYRNIMTGIIGEYSGRVVDAPGDNLLAEFSSIVNAVQSAVEIQKILKQKNTDIPNDKKLEFRIGVNIGDVVQDGGSLYGEGVNIAARIEGLADPGGICISRGAYDHVRNKLKLGYEYIGEHVVKNIKDPVRVYKVLTDTKDAGKVIGDEPKPLLKPGTRATLIIAAVILILAGYQVFHITIAPEFEPASIEDMAFPLPEKPSIAVLPFNNMSGDANQDYLCDGFTEDLITSIAKIPRIFVISRQSSFTYKGKPVNVKKVAEDLGVRYVLEGSIQKSGDQIRVNVQFIDALTGYHLWSERYDRKFEGIFKLKDEIIFKVATELAVELTEGERARALSRYTDNLEVWSTQLLATEIFMRHTKESMVRARELYRKALYLDPDYLPAFYGLAWTYFMDARHGWNNPRKKSFDQAVESANKALAIDDTYWGAHSILCLLYLLKRDFDKAEEYLQKAQINAPSTTDFHSRRAVQLNYLGRSHEAIEHFKEAMRLSPVYPAWYYYHLGLAYHLTGQHEKAIETLKKAVERTPDSIYPHPRLAMIYSDLGRMQEAKKAAAEVLRVNPQFTVEGWAKANPFKDPAIVEHRKELLRKAGLPD
ncbi:MAG: adenylate/guanylate cyclase domain-containing protein [Desulfocapsaceae bacterium]|nr:adenylate/guanylate cyclase domain-containing protein [Desulfocapsaceae bacterium]